MCGMKGFFFALGKPTQAISPVELKRETKVLAWRGYG